MLSDRLLQSTGKLCRSTRRESKVDHPSIISTMPVHPR